MVFAPARLAFVMVNGAVTAILNVLEDVSVLALSVTVTIIEYVATVVGVPLRTPDDERVKPAGTPVAVHVRVPEPAPVRVALNGNVVEAGGRVVVVIVGGSIATVRLSDADAVAPLESVA